MANPDQPMGLQLVGSMGGAHNAVTIRCNIPASDGTATFIGDPVKFHGTADADGFPTVIQCAAGDAISGVIISFEPNASDLTVKHRAASTSRYCQVCIDPKAIYAIQDDNNTAMAATSVGLNAAIIVGSGSTTSGLSGVELDSGGTTAPGTATDSLRIIGAVPSPDNDITLGNCTWLVMINEHDLAGLADGVGV